MHPPLHPTSSTASRRATGDTTGQPDAEVALLQTLGERVRDERTRNGMTRRGLAQDSGVSERYLSLLESGRGNISIVLLLRIATALNIPLAALLSRRHAVSQSHAHMAELELINALLQRIPAQKLPALRTDLQRKFGRSLKEQDQKGRRVALIGLRGAGKSTLGAGLARELDMPFIELDREIEREAGTSLSEIFLLYGQPGYRRYEKRCLENIIKDHDRVVIATGGSLVAEPLTYDLLLSSCTTVWLKALPEEHMARVVAQGDTRPMAGNREAMQDLRRILDSRAALYGRADITIDTAEKTTEKSLHELTRAITLQLEDQAE